MSSELGIKDMSKQWHGGKGDTPRVGNDEVYRSNWDRIFGGIDYKDEDLLEGLYHSEKMKGRLPQGKNIPAILSDTLLNPSDSKPPTT